MLLPIILVARIVLFPGLFPIHVERFESEKECLQASTQLDQSARVFLLLTCEIDT